VIVTGSRLKRPEPRVKADQMQSSRQAEELRGTFNMVRWAKEDGSWLIASLSEGQTVVGPAGRESFIRGCEYIFAGYWEDSSYGRQFKFTTFAAQQPVTSDSVKAYLRRYVFGSNAGIGEVTAGKLIARFGAADVLEVIRSEPQKAAEFAKIPLEKMEIASQILRDAEKFETTRMQLTALLEGRGFSQKLIDDAIKEFGVLAAERIRRDPFTLLVRGFHSAGFLRCEQLYRDLGLPLHRLKRQMICLWHLIQKADGSTWIDAEFAVGEMARLVSSKIDPKGAIRLGMRAKWLSTKRDEDHRLWIAETQEAIAEAIVARRVGEILIGSPVESVELVEGAA